MLTWRGLSLVGAGAVCLFSWGCEPPSAIVSSSEPGTARVRKLPDSEKNPAEALGEQSKATPTKKGEPAHVDENLKPAPPTAKGETKTTASGVKYETITEGNGAEAKPGQTATVHYTGTFEDGKEFDSSRGGQPFPFTIGAHGVIRGWEEGVTGMKVGERRKLTIPAEAAYGATGQGKIPPNSTLLFDIELLKVE